MKDNANELGITIIILGIIAIILSFMIKYNGVYTDNPKTNPDAKLVESVTDIPELLKKITLGNTNSFGTGGIRTKIQAAEKTTASGIPLVLANSRNKNPVTSLVDGSQSGTLFEPKNIKPGGA